VTGLNEMAEVAELDEDRLAGQDSASMNGAGSAGNGKLAGSDELDTSPRGGG
jgi:hypothetical protein